MTTSARRRRTAGTRGMLAVVATAAVALALAGCTDIGRAADSLGADAQSATAARELSDTLAAESGVTDASVEFQPLADTGRTLSARVKLAKDAPEETWTRVARDLAAGLDDDRLDDVIPSISVARAAQTLRVADARGLTGDQLSTEMTRWRGVVAASAANVAVTITVGDAVQRDYGIVDADIPALTTHWDAVVAQTAGFDGRTGWSSDGFTATGTPPAAVLTLLDRLGDELPIMTLDAPAAKGGSVALSWSSVGAHVQVFSPSTGPMKPSAAALRALRLGLAAGLPNAAASWNGTAAGAGISVGPCANGVRTPTGDDRRLLELVVGDDPALAGVGAQAGLCL